MKLATIVLFSCLLTFSGCAAPAYREIFQEKASYNSKEFDVPINVLYQATTRAVCARNFIIEKEDTEKGSLLAKRSFQKGKKTIVLVLQARMESNANDKTMIYLTALETTETSYVTDKTRFFLFLVPLPGGGGKSASQIKEGEKVIEDKKFYKDFLKAIQQEVPIAAAAIKEKALKTAQVVEMPRIISAPPVQEPVTSVTIGVEATLSNATTQVLEEAVDDPNPIGEVVEIGNFTTQVKEELTPSNLTVK